MCEFIAGIEPLHWAIVSAYLMDKRALHFIFNDFDLANASGASPCKDKRYVPDPRRFTLCADDGTDVRTRVGSTSIQTPSHEAIAIKTALRQYAARAFEQFIAGFGMVPLHSRSVSDRL